MHHQSAVEVEDQVQDTSESHVSVDDSDFEVAPSSGSQQGGGKRKNKKKSTRVCFSVWYLYKMIFYVNFWFFFYNYDQG